jgi:hypothetical protein
MRRPLIFRTGIAKADDEPHTPRLTATETP